MKKLKKAAVFLLSAVLAVQAFSVPAYALKDNKYILDYKKDVDEYRHCNYYWFFWLVDEGKSDQLFLEAKYIFWGTALVPDKINGKEVIYINGSSSSTGFDVNPENKYMKCVDDVVFSKDGKKLMSYPQNNTRENYNIPEGTEVIRANAISHSSYLKEIIIPESVVHIEHGVFMDCENLSTVTFLPGNSKLCIDLLAFWTGNLQEVTLPNFNVTIETSAFHEIGDVPKLTTYEQTVLKTENRTIKWDKIPNASYYEIYQKLNNGEYTLLGKTKSTSHTFSFLKPGAKYTLAVKPIAVIPAENYNKETDEGYYPETFTIEGTMSEDVVITG